MKNLDLREKYFNSMKNMLIYPLKNSDGMLNLASMQRVFAFENKLILVKGENKISIMNSKTSEFEYFIFNDENSLLKYITTSFDNGHFIITFSNVNLIGENLTISTEGAIMEINDIETIRENEKIISNNLINTLINIQKTGYANILNIVTCENTLTNEDEILSDLYNKKSDALKMLNHDLILKRG